MSDKDKTRRTDGEIGAVGGKVPGDRTVIDGPDAEVSPSHTAPYVLPDPQLDRTATDADPDDLQARILKKMASSAHVRKDPFIGLTISGKYEILAKVGTGGMGVVYKARQKGMDRFVAIKVLLKEYLSNEKAVKRFHREALAVSRLEHPNTIRIYDFGEAEAGTLYIAMEFLTGLPLATLLREQVQLPVRQTLRIVQQICRSLDEAHRKGIIHRDLKPDNVFVGAVEGHADYVKVLDFGVAKLREGTEDQGTLTQHGVIFGTPKYMSPEQCRSQEVDARSDLYAVGVMMFEMLAGRVPFDSDNALAILIMHSQDPVDALRDVRPDLVIPFEVEALMHRLLGKDAAERPQSAKDVVDACEDLLQRAPEEFEKVLTYDDAEKTGIKADRSQAYTVQSRPLASSIRAGLRGADEMDRETMAIDAPSLPMSRKKKAAIASFATVALLGVAAAAVWSQLTPLPASARGVIPAAPAATAELPPIEPELIGVTLTTNVGGVAVVDKATGRELGLIATADKPKRFDWLREPGRKVEVLLRHGDDPPKSYAFDLGQSQAPARFDFPIPLVPSEVPRVTLTVKCNVPGAVVQIEGQDAAYLIAEDGGEKNIPLAKGDHALAVTVKKTGYLDQSMPFMPAADGRLDVTLLVDPAAQAAPPAATVKVTITPNVGKVRVKVGSTGQMYETPEKVEEPFALDLPKGDAPVTLSFDRAGYKPAEQTVVPSEDRVVTVVLEKKKGPVQNGNPNGNPTGNTPEVIKIPVIKPAPESIKIGPIKGF